MSNFDTLSNLTGGRLGTAASIFSASTEDDLATITAAGYLNDLRDEGIVKQHDRFSINHDAVDLASAIPGEFIATVVASDLNLVAV